MSSTVADVLKAVVWRGRRLDGYSVDASGRVWSAFQLVPGWRIRWVIGDTPQELKPSPIGRTGGYHGVALRSNGRTIRASVHRLVAEAFLGPCPKGLEVCHEDGNGFNNALTNLRYDTKKNNHADKVRHGTHQFGERNPSAKLSNDEADAVRWVRKQGFKLRLVAGWFGVAEATVSRIANGKRRAA